MPAPYELALYQALDDVLTPVLAALTPSTAYYDLADPNSPYPFVELASIDFSTNPEITLDQQIATVTFSVFSSARGRAEVIRIQSAMRAALHTVNSPVQPPLDTGRIVLGLHLDSTQSLDGDGLSYMGRSVFQFNIAP